MTHSSRKIPLHLRLAVELALPDTPLSWLGDAPPGVAALATLALTAAAPVVLAVLPSPHPMDQFWMDAQAFLGPGADPLPDLLLFPMIEDGNKQDADALGRRCATIERILAPETERRPCLVVTCVQALMQPAADPRKADDRTVTLAVGDECDREILLHRLLAGGHEQTPEVVQKRDCAARGSLVDVWPLAAPFPYRVEIAEDRVESIRAFDPGDQRSTQTLTSIRIQPANLPRENHLLIDLLPDGSTVAWVGYGTVAEHAASFAENTTVARRHRLAGIREALQQRDTLRQAAFGTSPPDGWQTVELPISPLEDAVPAECRDPGLLATRRHAMLARLEQRVREEGQEVHLWLDTEGMREHLAAEIGDAPLHLRVAPLSGGFAIPALGVIVVAQPDVYGRSKRMMARRGPPRPAPSVSAGERLTSLDHITVGDLVVHVEHGIGRYRGMNEIEFNGQRHEVLTVTYADSAKLHVPIWHAHLLTRYVGTADKVRLHRLGGRRWSAEKTSVERAVEDLASAMLESQARRTHLPGHAFAAETPWLHEFEASFPYAETPDQARCFAEVKRDLQSPHPMDRLICGDAGYGKTEVAMRAAFLCAMQGRQVVILVPTTVLAQQHFDTFRDRMAPYPILLAMHSRFCTPAERSAALEGASRGTVDILIGTHGLLQPGVRFKDLGLVIIDEEQRFGVRHKEHFRALRTLVDVLTLSATPIPRTLQLGLTGVRDLSLLQTPPRDRVATETRVVEDTDAVIRTAIERELDRGGQVFYLYNRILTIERMRQRLERLVPLARIAVGHGQMPAAQVEEVMRTFASGDTDILLCTTIVESGVDIPRANTILVDRADRFGIAELYQLRGRVGRGPRKGHALFLIPGADMLDKAAKDRLQALRMHSGTGAAFQLALRDLGIRGAGNLLGAAQSGQIAAVGFTLYCQLLRATVARLKGEPVPRFADVEIRLDQLDVAPGRDDAGRAACFPYGYIDDESQRIGAYRRLAGCLALDEIEDLQAELTDRYGRAPPAVIRLLRVAVLRVIAATAGIQRIDVRNGQAWLFRDGAPIRVRGELPRIDARTADAQLDAVERLLRRLGAGNPARNSITFARRATGGLLGNQGDVARGPACRRTGCGGSGVR